MEFGCYDCWRTKLQWPCVLTNIGGAIKASNKSWDSCVSHVLAYIARIRGQAVVLKDFLKQHGNCDDKERRRETIRKFHLMRNSVGPVPSSRCATWINGSWSVLGKVGYGIRNSLFVHFGLQSGDRGGEDTGGEDGRGSNRYNRRYAPLSKLKLASLILSGSNSSSSSNEHNTCTLPISNLLCMGASESNYELIFIITGTIEWIANLLYFYRIRHPRWS